MTATATKPATKPAATKAKNSWRSARVADGLCAFCGKPRELWTYLCIACGDKHRNRQRLAAQRRRELRQAQAAAEDLVVAAKPEQPYSGAAALSPAPRPVVPVPGRPVKIGPPPRTKFAVGEKVSWFVVLPGLGATGQATRVKATGVVVDLDPARPLSPYLVREAATGVLYGRAAQELVLVGDVS